MATPAYVQVGADGWVRSICLHRGGFPLLLWDTLQEFGYVEPPEYVGREYIVLGVHRCEVVLDIPSTPVHPGWAPWRVVAHGHKLTDTWEIAALEALTKFCEKHPEEIMGTPAAFFPIRDQTDPQRVAHIRDLDTTTPGGAVLAAMVRYLIAMSNLIKHQDAVDSVTIDRLRDYHEQIQELEQKIIDRAVQNAHLEEKIKELHKQKLSEKTRIEHLKEEIKDELAKSEEIKDKLAKSEEANLKVACDFDNRIEHFEEKLKKYELRLAKFKEAKLKVACDSDNISRIEHFEEKLKKYELTLAKFKEYSLRYRLKEPKGTNP